MALAWDGLKTLVRTKTLRTIRQRRKTLRATLKQKLRRLIRREARLREIAASIPLTVDAVTELLDAMTLTDEIGNSPLQRTRWAINECVREQGSRQQLKLYAQTAHHAGKTTKQFFARLSTKYGDNTIHRLNAAAGGPYRGVHDKADILVDAWSPIFPPTTHVLRCCAGWGRLVTTLHFSRS